ncbi:hypothetical protein JCM11251_007135 [Rhodosporidiobolus azoricus]
MLTVASSEARGLASTLLPTPSPSPSPPSLRRRTPPPLNLYSSHRGSSLSSRSSAVDSAALREKHVAYARRIAEQVRLLHIAKAVYSSPRPQPSAISPTSSSLPSSSGREAAEASLRLTTYQLEVERFEGKEKVFKKVTVLIPGSGPERGAPCPSFTQATSTSRRRVSLPSLRTLSLLPPPPPSHLFKPARHNLPASPRSNQSSSPPSSTSSSSTDTEGAASLFSQLQRRRPALAIRQQQRESKLLTKYRVSRVRERMASLQEEGGDAGEVLSLAERRGRAVQPLRLV